MDPLNLKRTLVVKIGSSLLVDSQGQARMSWLDALAADVCDLRQRGWQVVLVSSGTIRLGLAQLGLVQNVRKLGVDQAAAAVGQITLAQAYRQAFAARDLSVAQVLLTLEDSEVRRRYLNALTTLKSLLELNQIPIVNENDTVATQQIRFGDNDRLAARVATMISAHWLVLLSDVDGLYTRDPSHPEAEHLAHVDAITPEIIAMAGVHNTHRLSRGGMATKLAAAQIVTQAGCEMSIADGRDEGALGRFIRNEVRSTLFRAHSTPQKSRKAWIQGSLNPSGKLYVDQGAINAIQQGKSLLAAGVKKTEGVYGRGDTVAIVASDAKEVARGLTAYDSDEVEPLCGLHSSRIVEVLGYTRGSVLVHADDLVISTKAEVGTGKR